MHTPKEKYPKNMQCCVILVTLYTKNHASIQTKEKREDIFLFYVSWITNADRIFKATRATC